jgi:hypothetical protein
MSDYYRQLDLFPDAQPLPVMDATWALSSRLSMILGVSGSNSVPLSINVLLNSLGYACGCDRLQDTLQDSAISKTP